MYSTGILVYLPISFVIFLLSSCSQQNETKHNNEFENTTKVIRTAAELPLKNSDSTKVNVRIDIDNLNGTVWIHQPFKESVHCIDTLKFLSDSTGYEYRCEFESFNKIAYLYLNDTLEIHEYGFVSEVSDLGLELKYRWRYVRINDKLNLFGYGVGTAEPIKGTKQLIYQLLKLTD